MMCFHLNWCWDLNSQDFLIGHNKSESLSYGFPYHKRSATDMLDS